MDRVIRIQSFSSNFAFRVDPKDWHESQEVNCYPNEKKIFLVELGFGEGNEMREKRRNRESEPIKTL